MTLAMCLSASYDARAQTFCLTNGGSAATASGSNAFGCGPGASATGTSATAIGNTATANGASSTAIGQSAQANGENTLASGQNAQATAAGATAEGQGAQATAVSTTAVGQDAQATGTSATAAGQGAQATAVSTTAVGQNAQATGAGATAVGQGAQATAIGSTAIGGPDSNGTTVTASLQDQMVLGTTRTTYTAPGITSGLSASRQSGPLEVVTTDANGNLASDGGQIHRQLGKLGAGVAIATALTNPDLVAGETFGITANAGFFDHNAALAFSAAGVVGRNFAGRGERWAVSGGVGISVAEQEFGRQTTGTQLAGRAGVQVSW